MHEVLSAAQMREADRLTIANGVHGIALMEAAGEAVADAAAALVPSGPVLVLRRAGNNGGDGFVAARRTFAEAGREVRCCSAIPPDCGRRGAGAPLLAGAGRFAALPLPRASPSSTRCSGSGSTGRSTASPPNSSLRSMPPVFRSSPSTSRAGSMPTAAARSAPPSRPAPRSPSSAEARTCFICCALCGSLTLAQIGIRDPVIAETGAVAVENTPRSGLWRADSPRAEAHKYQRGLCTRRVRPPSRTGRAARGRGGARAGAGPDAASPAAALAVNAAHLTAIMLARVDGGRAGRNARRSALQRPLPSVPASDSAPTSGPWF